MPVQRKSGEPFCSVDWNESTNKATSLDSAPVERVHVILDWMMQEDERSSTRRRMHDSTSNFGFQTALDL